MEDDEEAEANMPGLGPGLFGGPGRFGGPAGRAAGAMNKGNLPAEEEEVEGDEAAGVTGAGTGAGRYGARLGAGAKAGAYTRSLLSST